MRVVDVHGIPVHDTSFESAVELLARWATEGTGGYVCTPNVDHVVKADRDAAFRAAVLGARLRLPDGMGIVYGSRIAGRPLSGTVTGRLLPEAVGRRMRKAGRTLALFGGLPDVAEAAARTLRSDGILVADAFGPSSAFRVGSAEDDTAVARLRDSEANLIFVGLGAPKQEIWMARHSPELPRTVLVGVGAALDVLAGRLPAAPAWMTKIGLEWAYRLTHEPGRLSRRYLWDDPPFFWWMVKERLRRPG